MKKIVLFLFVCLSVHSFPLSGSTVYSDDYIRARNQIIAGTYVSANSIRVVSLNSTGTLNVSGTISANSLLVNGGINSNGLNVNGTVSASALQVNGNSIIGREQTNIKLGINHQDPLYVLSIGAINKSAIPTYSAHTTGHDQGFMVVTNTGPGTNYATFLDIGVGSASDGVNGGGAIRFLTQPHTSSVPPTETVRIDINGNVGIGKTAPSTKLEVAGTVSANEFGSTWIDYSGTSTVVGWSSFNTKIIKYKTVGSLVFVNYVIDGTSNSATTTFTVPFADASGDNTNSIISAVVNNGVEEAAGRTRLEANTTTCTFIRTAGQAWTASGTKVVAGQFFYRK